MGFNNRELEVKLLVDGQVSLTEISSLLKNMLEYKKIIHETSKDEYWKPASVSKADFIRLRHYSNGRAQLTVKYTDKGDNFDRVEQDLDVEDPKQMALMLNSILGKRHGEIVKEYVVFVMDAHDTTISVYQIKRDRRVFIEVEARTKKKVQYLVSQVQKIIPEFSLIREKKSLYELFLKNKRPNSKIFD